METQAVSRAAEEGGIAARSPSRFVGRAECKIDAKGRVSVPADFRRSLGPAGSPLFACASLTDPVIECGGEDLVTLMLEAIASMDVYDEERWMLEEAVTEETVRLSFDDNGRVVLPAGLRAHAGLEGLGVFAGRGQRFVLAAAALMEQKRKAARDVAARHRETLKARSLASVTARRDQ